MSDESVFRIASGRRLALILLVLVLTGGFGLTLVALLGDDVDIDPFIPERGPDREAAASVAQVDDPEAGQGGDDVEEFGPGDEGVVVVPEGWSVQSRSNTTLVLGSGDGVHLALAITGATPSTPATGLLTDTQSEILSPTIAAHVRTSEVVGLQPFGALVTRSALGYSALRTDAQGLSSVGGNLFVFVREDGLALTVNPEVTPAEHWEARIGDWYPLWASAVSNFAGTPTPAGSTG